MPSSLPRNSFVLFSLSLVLFFLFPSILRCDWRAKKKYQCYSYVNAFLTGQRRSKMPRTIFFFASILSQIHGFHRCHTMDIEYYWDVFFCQHMHSVSLSHFWLCLWSFSYFFSHLCMSIDVKYVADNDKYTRNHAIVFSYKCVLCSSSHTAWCVCICICRTVLWRLLIHVAVFSFLKQPKWLVGPRLEIKYFQSYRFHNQSDSILYKFDCFSVSFFHQNTKR